MAWSVPSVPIPPRHLHKGICRAFVIPSVPVVGNLSEISAGAGGRGGGGADNLSNLLEAVMVPLFLNIKIF